MNKSHHGMSHYLLLYTPDLEILCSVLRLFILPKLKHLSFMSPTFIYSQVDESDQVSDSMFLVTFWIDSHCFSIKQGGKKRK